VQVPVFQDRIQEVIVEKNVYIEVEKIVERVVDKLVELKTVEERIINHETVQERVIEVIKEVPK
jgi:deoxyhypusine synthase